MPGWVTVPLGQMYNPVFFIGTAYAIHGDTYVPLQPVSRGCVRIPMDIARPDGVIAVDARIRVTSHHIADPFLRQLPSGSRTARGRSPA